MNSKIFERFREYINTSQFNALRVSIASPEKVRSLSYGEVKKIETINYRTLKPERDGLFCARIFGPQKDWECNCGKYKRMKHRGVTCEKCGVEVIESRVRRERMGHISLVSPVCHIWYVKGIPSYLSLILGMTVKDLERVIYFDSYIVLQQGNSPYTIKTLLSSVEYDDYVMAHPDDIDFKADMGAEAVKVLLEEIDLSFEVRKIESDTSQTSSVAVRHKLGKRFRLLTRMLKADIRPEWIVMEVLPVLPPDLRPLVPLEGGRFASSDLNDLYRRVLNRNIRLRRLIDLDAPDVIIKNEKRMLQESVDALIDNGRRGQPVRGTNKRPLKSLSEMLRGKHGRFRQNLLGKRVDYSARSVIVVEPELKMHQCALPKMMALELFKPYVYVELQRRELAPNLRVTKKMVEDMTPEVWEALEAVVQNRPVLLNRAPTLHRLGIQAFFPILVEGKAIKIHPLVCSAFNADFDGDTMSVHVPLSKKAQEEARTLILSTNNVLSPASGKPIASPSKDMVLGLYYITKGRKNVRGEGLIFASLNELISAYQRKVVDVHAFIKYRMPSGEIVDTTVGRVLVHETMPQDAPIEWVNKALKSKDIKALVGNIYRYYGKVVTVDFLDKVKKLGFYNATIAGLSLSIENLLIPAEKDAIIKKAQEEVERIEGLYAEGAITNGERYNKVIQTWDKATQDVAGRMIDALEEQDRQAFLNEKGNTEFNPVFLMLDSGARGSQQQIRQLGGMRGLMAKPSGEIQETPVLSNFKQGLNVFEYFISTHGARKGLADTALKTADSGYLTRRLVDVAQDVVVTEKDCGSIGFTTLNDIREGGDVIEPLTDRIYGRMVAQDVFDPISGKIVLKHGELVTHEQVERVAESSVSEVPVRSVLTCHARRGVCAQCYGLDLSTGELVYIGVAVGIIAAQSIGEPGTQLTMRTFHIGGIASGLGSQSMYKASADGILKIRNAETVVNKQGQVIIVNRKGELTLLGEDGRERDSIKLEYGSTLLAKDGQVVKKGDKIVEWDPNNKVIVSSTGGTVRFVDLVENITFQEKYDEATGRSRKVVLERKEEKRQPCIMLTLDGSDEDSARYYLPTGSHLYIEEGDVIAPGTILAKLGREEQRTKDITGGLPRVAELFEARIAKDAAIISEVEGIVRFDGIHRGNRKISVITDEEEVHEHSVPRSKHLNVEDGDRVHVGDALTAGASNVHDILRVLGPDELQKYLIKEIQSIYTLQGVGINDKHIEVIIRQMLKKVSIASPGDTDFVAGDRIDKVHFQNVNKVMLAEGKRVAVAKPVLMGITKASLGTDSLISAASFQETTRVLASAAIEGKVDYLYGLKENVIIGKLIPAGTGVPAFKAKYLGEDVSDLERQAREEERLEMSLDNISLE